jgi:lantibiotic modifying enzyme
LLYQEHAEQIFSHLLTSIDQDGWIMGVPLNIETPGLMTGLAGIGYELLRFVELKCVPSLLLLRPPVI